MGHRAGGNAEIALNAERSGYTADSDGGDAHAASAADPAGLDFIHV